MSPFQAVGADSTPSVPPVIQAGFTSWAKGGVVLAFDAWQKGGFMAGDRKIAAQSNYFKRLDRAIGSYKSYELIETKEIGLSSEIVYLAVNFEQGGVYARFLLYRTDKGWIVQDMDFSTKPEAIMPWLAFAGGTYTE